MWLCSLRGTVNVPQPSTLACYHLSSPIFGPFSLNFQCYCSRKKSISCYLLPLRKLTVIIVVLKWFPAQFTMVKVKTTITVYLEHRRKGPDKVSGATFSQ